MTQAQLDQAVQNAISKYTGQKVAYEGYPGECLSLVKQYLQDTYGFTAPASGNGEGSGYYTNFPAPLPQYFVKENFNKSQNYPEGSLLVNTPTAHIAILIQSQGANSLVFEQNANPNGSPAHEYARPNTLFDGILVPITTAPPNGDVGKTLHLPADNVNWHVYNPNGPYDLPHAIAVLHPAKFGGLSYTILGDKGNGIFLIKTQDFGEVAIWTNGTNASVA